ncbi:MAG: transposase, partial [Candidatus Diapherotrites archaeon]|nr:transposase [Candidatus Diapherotrites archaeon]
DHWFTFILHPEIEPTNNRAERGIRETVVQRKIYGCLRNQIGTRNHDVLTSLIATWEQRNLNPYTQLQQALRG